MCGQTEGEDCNSLNSNLCILITSGPFSAEYNKRLNSSGHRILNSGISFFFFLNFLHLLCMSQKLEPLGERVRTWICVFDKPVTMTIPHEYCKPEEERRGRHRAENRGPDENITFRNDDNGGEPFSLFFFLFFFLTQCDRLLRTLEL